MQGEVLPGLPSQPQPFRSARPYRNVPELVVVVVVVMMRDQWRFQKGGTKYEYDDERTTNRSENGTRETRKLFLLPHAGEANGLKLILGGGRETGKKKNGSKREGNLISTSFAWSNYPI